MSDLTKVGAYRRRIDLATRQHADGAGEARIAVEDDHHRIRVAVISRDGAISEVSSESIRVPSVICPSAAQDFQKIVGMPLDPSCAATLLYTDPRQQCTHLVEMAGLGTAALVRGIRRRTYQADVYDPVDGVQTATLRRDGDAVLEWRIDSNKEILAPKAYAGQSLLTGFMRFVKTLELEEAEAAMVLRRAYYTALGRGMDLDASNDSMRAALGQCWARQPERVDSAHRNIGSTKDFTDRPEALTSQDRDWVDFAS